MLRVGVPEYRLPKEIIEREVADIVDLGVDLRLNSPVTNLDDVFTQGYDAVLIAVGAHEGIRPPIPGADLDGVLSIPSFYATCDWTARPKLGIRVVVIGSGDVAMDCARTAVRLGKEVHVHYRRSPGMRQPLTPLRSSTPRLKASLSLSFKPRRDPGRRQRAVWPGFDSSAWSWASPTRAVGAGPARSRIGACHTVR